MAVLALVLIGIWLVVVACVRTIVHAQRTGDAKVVRTPTRSGSAGWWAGLVSSVGFVCAVAAPVAELVGMDPIAALDRTPVRVAGVVLVVGCVAASFGAQLAMGDSWRANPDPQERTSLVTTGPFRLVRNPIFTATATVLVGLALMVPNWLAVAALVASVTALEIQVRLVEEPYLHRAHGSAYAEYAARTGRFLPWLGRYRPSGQ
jgi:protein-S-isoprenylcysteine O-methyltransferase Ste14